MISNSPTSTLDARPEPSHFINREISWLEFNQRVLEQAMDPDVPLLDVLATQSRLEYQSRMFESLDERSKNVIESLVGDFFGRLDKYTYYYLLPKAIYVIAQNDAIILGRGAHLLLPDAFRVRLRACAETRVKNLMAQQGLSKKEAAAAVKRVDKERSDYIKELSGKLKQKVNELDFDLGINMDRLDIDETVSIILHASEQYFKKLSAIS